MIDYKGKQWYFHIMVLETIRATLDALASLQDPQKYVRTLGQ